MTRRVVFPQTVILFSWWAGSQELYKNSEQRKRIKGSARGFESGKKKKNTKKWNTNQSAFVEMAGPEPNNPYVITMARIDPALRTSHDDIHYWLTDWLKRENKMQSGRVEKRKKKERKRLKQIRPMSQTVKVNLTLWDLHLSLSRGFPFMHASRKAAADNRKIIHYGAAKPSSLHY